MVGYLSKTPPVIIRVLNSPVIDIEIEKLMEIILVELVPTMFILIRTILSLAVKLLTVLMIAVVVVLSLLSQHVAVDLIATQNLVVYR